MNLLRKRIIAIVFIIIALLLLIKPLGSLAQRMLFYPLTSLKLMIALVVLILLWMFLNKRYPGWFSRVILHTKKKAPVVQAHIQEKYSVAHGHTSNWIQKFRSETPQGRWRMTRIPLAVVVTVLLVVTFGHNFLPPKIDTSFPGNKSQEAPLDTTIEVIFSRGVVKSLVENGITITPKIEGKISWEGNQKLIFTPKSNLKRGTVYKVEINGIVVSNFLSPLIGNRTITFETIGNPKVVLASPQNEALENQTPITIVFDRPMIPFTTADNREKKSPFEINPPLKGVGRWLGTTAYQFRPEERYRTETTYQVTVPKGIKSQDGGIMQEDYKWDFSSERPHVAEVSPTSEYTYASPTASVAATFNHRIDKDSISDKFIVLDSHGNKVPGRIVVTNEVVGFYSSQPLKRQERYKAVVRAGVQGVEGPNGTESNYEWSFVVASAPEILRTTPKNGDKDVSEQSGAQVSFKTPMDETSFENNITISPEPELKPSIYFSSYDQTHTLSINSYFGRSKKYTITVGSGVTDQYGVALGKSYSFSFNTAPYKPTVSINPSGTYFGAFNQQVVPRVVAQVINANKVDYALYKLKREDFLDLYRRRYDQQCGSVPDCQNWQNYDPSKLEKVRTWSQSFQADLNTPVHVVTKVTKSNGDKIPPGLYFLDIKIPGGIHDNMVMVVSKSTLTIKKSDKQIFSWAVNQTSTNVVGGMKMQLTDVKGTVLSEGTTNNDGVFMKKADLFQKSNLFMFGAKDDDVVVASSTWGNGISTYDFGLPSYYNYNEQSDYYNPNKYKQFITVDRPIYRPGQKVYFKGVIRKDNDGAYENLKPGEKVTVSINDANGHSVHYSEIPITSFGSFSGDFSLSKDASLGYYQVTTKFDGNSFNQQFQVEEYKKPELALTVEPGKEAYTQGERAGISINASYYFGSPVTDTKVNWTLQTQDSSFRWDKDWRFEFGDPDSYWSQPWWYYSGNSYYSGRTITEGKGTTNSKGDLELSFPLDISKEKTSQEMRLFADVSDINNQAIGASKEFTVHKAAIYAGLKPVSYGNQMGRETKVEVVTVDTKGSEVPNVPVGVEFYKRTWDTVREQNPDDGLFYYTSKPNDALVSSTSVTTDSLGRATAAFTPSEGGTYKVVSKVTDNNGNQNVTGSFLWVSGYGFSAERENNDRIVVVTDKRDYFVGDNLSVFVASPFSSSSAKTLLTAERGSVLDYKVVNTNNESNNFPMSIDSKYTPNVFIGALLVKGGDQIKNPAEFKMGYSAIKVTDKKQQIDVKITTDKKRYKPRDTMTVTVQTNDLLGHPVSSELALGLVDKAVWDLANVGLPDIYNTFYQPRSLTVDTSQLLTISIDRINANTNLGAKGGSGGGGGGGANDTTRSNFPDTAYWNPHLVTGSDGKATIQVKLPDSLTTWKLDAIANSAQSSFGSVISEVVVARDVLIRPFLPRFLSVGDMAKLGAIIVNTSGQDQTIVAKIETKGIQIREENSKQISVPDGGQAKVVWDTVTQDTKTATVKISVAGNDGAVKDGIQILLPVNSYSVPETVAVAGQAKDTATEKIVLPKDVDKTQGQANITYSPSLGSASFTSLSYLTDYTYYCTEQTTSKFLPAVFVNSIMKNAKIAKSGDVEAKQLEIIINDGIQRLNKEQHSDGGWGWWVEFDSEPFMTAYAYQGLSEAKKEKFTVASQTLSRAQSYLLDKLARGDSDSISLNTQAFILYVLRGSGLNLSSYASNLYEKRYQLSVEARAYLAISMKEIGMGGQARKVYGELLGLAKKTATTTHWEEQSRGYNYMGSNTTATATALEALIVFDKNSPLVSEVTRYLLSIRQDNHWSSTRDTASVIKAIATQLSSKSDQNLNEQYKLSLNGKVLDSGKFTKDDLLSFRTYSIKISQFKLGQENKMQLTKSGEGNLYYNINMKYFLPFSEIKPLEQGIVVVREFIDGNGKVLPGRTMEENTEAWVRLTIVAPEERYFVAIEDMLPAGLESVNESLKNVTRASKPPKQSKGTSSLYFQHTEFHDDRTTVFADYLSPGVYEITYRVRATTPGRYHYPPAQAYQMNIPDISGHSDGGWLEIK